MRESTTYFIYRSYILFVGLIRVEREPRPSLVWSSSCALARELYDEKQLTCVPVLDQIMPLEHQIEQAGSTLRSRRWVETSLAMYLW